jgi:Holliday junction resolvase RusA-like endonuclease
VSRDSVTFTVEGRPRGKSRPRFANGHAYTPKSTREAEDAVRAAYLAKGVPAFDGPLHVLITAHFRPPSRLCKAERERMAAMSEYHTSKPDADNIAKLVLDALQGAAYPDDAQVSSVSCVKVYGLDECTVVSIRALA